MMVNQVSSPIQSADSFATSLQTLRAKGLVRLDDAEAAALAAAIDGVPADAVELFGSRTDPVKKGGDIDLLVLTAASRFETARRVSCRFFMHCEERIDVVVLNPERLTAADEAFVRSLRRVRIT